MSGCGAADGDGSSLHRFPSDRRMAAVWLQRCHLPAHTDISDRLAVCGRHFSPTDLVAARSGGRRDPELRLTAVPSRFLDR